MRGKISAPQLPQIFTSLIRLMKKLSIVGLVLLSVNTLSAQLLLSSSSYTQDFNTIGATATATLPAGWSFSHASNYTSLTSATTQTAGTTGTGVITGTAPGGYYNFGEGINASTADRAAGFLTSGSFAGPRYLYFGFTNNTGSLITALAIEFDYEKYRSGTRGMLLNFETSADTVNWANWGSGYHATSNDANNTVVSNPALVTHQSVALSGLEIADGSTIYLRWTYQGVGGSTNAQAFAIDNFTMDATLAPVPEPATYAAIIGALALVGVVAHRRCKQA